MFSLKQLLGLEPMPTLPKVDKKNITTKNGSKCKPSWSSTVKQLRPGCCSLLNSYSNSINLAGTSRVGN